MAGEARTGDAEVEGCADDERSEADGMSGAMSPEAASRVRRADAGRGSAEGALATGDVRDAGRQREDDAGEERRSGGD